MERKLTDIADSLGLPLRTLGRWIRQGRIPVQKIGDRGVFDEAVLNKWAAKHQVHQPADRNRAPASPEPVPETLVAAMKAGGVHYRIPGNDVAAVLSAAVDAVPGLSKEMRGELYRRLLEREQLTSTGIGKGVAIPHPRTPIMDETDQAMIVTCFLERPVAFDAVDDKPVSILFVLLSPSVKLHLHLLSRLAFCVRDNGFVRFLGTMPDPEALFVKITAFEKRLQEQ